MSKNLIRNLGKALGIMALQDVREDIMHDDISAWGAPSECHELVASGEDDRRRRARRHAEAVAQRPYRIIKREAKQRGFTRRHADQLNGRLHAKYNPFDQSEGKHPDYR
jgi:hypothetical protein